jgi:hypothetical protein
LFTPSSCFSEESSEEGGEGEGGEGAALLQVSDREKADKTLQRITANLKDNTARLQQFTQMQQQMANPRAQVSLSLSLSGSFVALSVFILRALSLSSF